MLEYIFKKKSAWRTWGLQLILTPQSCLKKNWNCQCLKAKHTGLKIALNIGNLCYTRVAKNCLHLRQFVRRYAYTFQALAISRFFFKHDCGVNISYCRLHVPQADLFVKIYSSIWLSQNFLCYNSILQHSCNITYFVKFYVSASVSMLYKIV
jgi:hypothetical protein